MNRKGVYRCGFLSPDNKKEYEFVIPDPRDKLCGLEEIRMIQFGFTVRDGEPVLAAYIEPCDTVEIGLKQEIGTYTHEEFQRVGGEQYEADMDLCLTKRMLRPLTTPWATAFNWIHEGDICLMDFRSFERGEENSQPRV